MEPGARYADVARRHEIRALELSQWRRRCERGGLSIRALAAERRRFGYRLLGMLLEREGPAMNEKKLFRL
jgi:transposase-like protein